MAVRRKRTLKYVRRVSLWWRAFVRYSQKRHPTLVVLDDRSRELLSICIEVQREFTRYFPHPENLLLLERLESLLRPGAPTGGGEPVIVLAARISGGFTFPCGGVP